MTQPWLDWTVPWCALDRRVVMSPDRPESRAPSLVRRLLAALLFSAAVAWETPCGAETATFFGPEEFRPNARHFVTVVTRRIPLLGHEPRFVLHARNGDAGGGARVAAAAVLIDGRLVLTPFDFWKPRPTLETDVQLVDQSRITVWLMGWAGSRLTIWIEGTAPSLRVAPVLDQDLSVTAPISIDGGSVSTTLPDGTTLTLDVPEAALSQATDIKLTPLAVSTVLPAGPPLVAGAQLEPAGLVFARPVHLRIDLGSSPPAEVVGFKYDGTGEGYRLAPVARDGNSFSVAFYHFSGGGLKEKDASECDELAARGPTDPSAALEYRTACGPEDDALAADAIAWMTTNLNLLEAALTPVVAALDAADSLGALRQALGGYAGWRSQADRVGEVWDNVQLLVGDEYGRLQAALDDKRARALAAARGSLVRGMALAETACAKATSCETMKASLDDLLFLQKWIDLMPGFDDLVVDMSSLCGGALGLQVTTDASVYAVGMTGSATAVPGHVVPDSDLSVTWSSSPPNVLRVDPSSGVFSADVAGTGVLTASGSYCGIPVSGTSSPVRVLPECAPLPDGTATCSMTLSMLAYRPPHRDWIGTGERRRLRAEVTNLLNGAPAEMVDPIVWRFEGPGDGIVLWEEVEGSDGRFIDIIGSRMGDFTAKAAVGQSSLSATLPLRVVRLETYRGGPATFSADVYAYGCRFWGRWDVESIGLAFWGEEGWGRSSGTLQNVTTPLSEDAMCSPWASQQWFEHHWVAAVSGQSLTGPWLIGTGPLQRDGTVSGTLGDGMLVLTFSHPDWGPVTVTLQRTSIGVIEDP